MEGVETLELSGVAPMAQVFNYKSNYAASPEYIAALDQMVLDEIDAMNMSQGHVGWLLDHYETHPMAQAFEGAADAGVVVVMSAGNDGRNGLTSLSATFKYSPKVLAVGSSSNSVSSYMMNLRITGDGAPAESYPVGGRGSALFTQTITAPLVFVADGGCAPTPAAQGAIAVVERFNADGSWIGTCGYTARAGFMKDSGAVAILYVYYDRTYGNLSRTALALPGISIGSLHDPDFVAWLKGNPAGATGIIEPDARRLPAEPHILAGSSRPAPGYDWSLKPDLTAPGHHIPASVTGAPASGRPVRGRGVQ